MSDLQVVDNPPASRYEVLADGQVAGFVTYRAQADRVVLTHAEVRPEFEGRGVGGALAAGTLDDLRRRGLAVVPRCPFMAAYIDKHPDYQDMVVRPT